MKVLVLGCGFQGKVIVRDLLESPNVSQVVVADRRVEAAKPFVDKVSSDKLSVEYVDVTDHEKLGKLMRGNDVVANATPYSFGAHVARAAIEARTNSLDLGGLYHITRKMLEMDKAAKDAGITIIPGCGASPGTTNVLAKLGASKLDEVEEIRIRAGLTGGGTYAISTIFDELTLNPVIYQNGKVTEVEPLSGYETVPFLEPVGEAVAQYSLHTELATIPQSLNVKKTVDFKVAFAPEVLANFKTLVELGFTSTKPIKLDGAEISPRDFVCTYLSSLPLPEPGEKDAFALKVEVLGKSDGKDVKYVYDSINGPHERWEEGKNTVAFGTGVAASLTAQMLGRGEIKLKGVVPPEVCIKPEPYIAELTKKGIKTYETVIRPI